MVVTDFKLQGSLWTRSKDYIFKMVWEVLSLGEEGTNYRENKKLGCSGVTAATVTMISKSK